MHLYGLIIGISIVIGINYFSSKKVLSSKLENFFIFGLLLSSILGARIYHVIDQWSYYSQHLNQIFATWNGGLGIYGGLIAGFIFILVFSYLNKISLLTILNAITPILPLCQAIGRLGNFVNHEIPFWWLEAILNLILFLIIKFFPKNPSAKYFIGYGLIRFIFEYFRTDTWSIANFKIAQVISLFLFIIGITISYHDQNKKNT